MKKILVCVVLSFSLLLSCSHKDDKQSSNNASPEFKESVSNDPNNPDNVIVVVEGTGETLEAAKKDAFRSAVEKAVGSLVDAQSRVDNAEAIEQILSSPSAYVEKHQVLNNKVDNGIAKVAIQATVIKTSLSQKLRFSGGGQTIAIDGASLAGKAATKAEAEKQGALLLANFLKKEEFPYRLLDVKIVGDPKITQTGNEVTYKLYWEISANRERYMDFVKRLQPILDKSALRKSSFVLELNKQKDSDGDIYFTWSSDQVNSMARKPNIPFYLCTGIMGDYRSLKYESYELPQKYKIPLQYYGRIAPVINIVLLNSKSEEIATRRIVFCQLDYGSTLLPFNLCPPLKGSLDFDRIKQAGESTIAKTDIYTEGLNWLSISPFPRETRDLCFYPTVELSSELTISSEELAQVKSVSISVITNNPAMDDAFARMPDEIDKVPTN